MTRTLALVSLVALVLGPPTSADAWGRGAPHFSHFPRFHHSHHVHHFDHFRGCCFAGGFAVGVFTGFALGSAVAPVYAYPAPAYVAPPADAPPPPAYWYFCRSAGAYYPYVASCPEPWVPVLAQ